MIEIVGKLEIEENFLNLIKIIYKRHIANVILNGEKLEALLLNQVKGKDGSSHHPFPTLHLMSH